jgi:beta-1,4-mannosyl-glycoprotein beta-1,4-N-acetylglucosaminyltransferase
MQGLYEARADKNDLVIISDADEIVKSETISEIDNFILPARLDVKQYFWNFHWQVPKHCDQGARPVICEMEDLKHMTPQYLRSLDLPLIENGGWHFSFFGEQDKIINKIESFAHTEYDKNEYKSYENILSRIQNGIDPFDRFPLKYYEIDQTYPKWVFKNKD